MSAEQFTYTQEGEWAKSPERQRRRVIITEMGIISPLGNDAETSWANLIASKSGIQPVTMPELAQRSNFPKLGVLRTKVGVAGLVNLDYEQELLRYLPSEMVGSLKKNIKGSIKFDRLGDTAQLALLASAQALFRAGLLKDGKIIDGINKDRFGVRIGTLIGNTAHFVRTSETIQSQYDKERKNGLHIGDTLITDPARISAVPSIVFGLRGPKETPIAACATGNLAIIGAYQDIFNGDADIMLAGGADYKIDPMGIGMFDALTALAETDRSREASRPLDKAHSGFVMAEGAGVFVMETMEHAQRRGAKILAELAGYSKPSDAESDTAPTGHAAEYGLAEALSRSGLPDKGIIYINAHATGTKVGDGVEPLAYKKVLNVLPYNHEVVISATKASTGHTLGASGAIEAGFAVMALTEGVVPPTIGIENPIDEVKNMNIVPNDAQVKQVEVSVNANFAFGGASAITVFRKPR